MPGAALESPNAASAQMNAIPVPADLRTDRLFLRAWQEPDAVLLLPTLEANVDHLADWIPMHVSAPASLAELELRLTGFADDFEAGRCWRYAIFSLDEGELFGEVSLFPRWAEGRVELKSADRLEIGYWLRNDVTGKGYATEAARAMLQLAATVSGISSVEIHCHSLNIPSAAIPRRLGFRLTPPEEQDSTLPHEPDNTVWAYDVRTGV